MPPLLSAGNPTDLAHVVHFGIVFAGLAGLTALLAPSVAGRMLPEATTRGHDDHARRVVELQHRIRAGTLARPEPAPRPAVGDTPAAAGLHGAVLPVVLISSGAAAGVHAAVTPTHLTGGALVTAFFVVTALAQLTWTIAVWAAPTTLLLRLGTSGNAAVVALWLISRTVGLPVREGVGPWDVASVVWELMVVAGCLHLLHRGGDPRPSWHPVAGWWLGISVVCLGVLSVSGSAA